MAKVILLSLVIFFVLDFAWYLYLKNARFENYESYIDYFKKKCK